MANKIVAKFKKCSDTTPDYKFAEKKIHLPFCFHHDVFWRKGVSIRFKMKFWEIREWQKVLFSLLYLVASAGQFWQKSFSQETFPVFKWTMLSDVQVFLISPWGVKKQGKMLCKRKGSLIREREAQETILNDSPSFPVINIFHQ